MPHKEDYMLHKEDYMQRGFDVNKTHRSSALDQRWIGCLF
jgi:hypothetical protein